MEGTRTIWLFLLISQMLFWYTDADQQLSPSPTDSSKFLGSSPSYTVEPSLTTTDHTDITNGTRADCLIDTEMGLIAIGSAGGLIICLLLTTAALACQVCHLQRRMHVTRSRSRQNMDLVSGTDYWSTDQAEIGGLIGPCDASVMLEEVRADNMMEEDRQAEIKDAMDEGEMGHKDVAAAMVFHPEEKASQMQSYNYRDSSLEVPRDLENMPLVV